jgi:hypothetical protein
MPKRKRLPQLLLSKPACWSWPMPADHREYSADGMFRWHEHRCAVCAAGQTVVDHDHETGLVRGLLCVSCNNGEARHDGVFLLYRKINPAYMFDVHIRWSDNPQWRYRQWRAA